MMQAARMSVVIPTIGRPILVRTLKSVLGCEGGRALDVLVMGEIRDQQVRREVDAILSAHANVRFFRFPGRPEIQAARKITGRQRAVRILSRSWMMT